MPLLNDRGDNTPYQLEQSDTGGVVQGNWNPNGRDAVTVHGGVLPRCQAAPGVAPSPPSGPIVVPGAPLLRTVTLGSKGSVVVTFYAPANNGGAAVTGYTVIDESNGTRFKASASPATVTGLTSGTKASFAVAATNSAGQGPCSEVSQVVTVP